MANSFTTNPIRVDSVMASDYLTTIGASAGLERPIKVTELNIEATAAGGGGLVTIQDGSSGANVLREYQLTAATLTNILDDVNVPLTWRNFKVTAIPTNTILWIQRR